MGAAMNTRPSWPSVLRQPCAIRLCRIRGLPKQSSVIRATRAATRLGGIVPSAITIGQK